MLELVLLVLTTASGICAFASNKKQKRLQLLLLSLSSILFTAHGIVEGLRLQMACVYLALPVLWIVFLFNKRRIARKNRIFLSSLSIICLLGTLFALYLFPVNTMPNPTGLYAIGTVSYELTELGRAELYGSEPGKDRHIRFQVWYPADSNKDGKLTKWLIDGRKVASGIPVLYDLPSFLLDHTALIKSHSYTGLSISDKDPKQFLAVPTFA